MYISLIGERYDFEAHRIGEFNEKNTLKIEGIHRCASLSAISCDVMTKTDSEMYSFKPGVDYEVKKRAFNPIFTRLKRTLQALSAFCSELDAANVCSTDLDGFAPLDFKLIPDQTFYLQFGMQKVSKVSADELEFRFVFDEIEYYPTFLDSSEF
jgi:hypothetical protein